MSLTGGLENEDQRHPSTEHMMRMLRPNENLRYDLFEISSQFYSFAGSLVDDLPDSPELTAGLRKLLEAKDCIIRAFVFKDLSDANVNYRDH